MCGQHSHAGSRRRNSRIGCMSTGYHKPVSPGTRRLHVMTTNVYCRACVHERNMKSPPYWTLARGSTDRRRRRARPAAFLSLERSHATKAPVRFVWTTPLHADNRRLPPVGCRRTPLRIQATPVLQVCSSPFGYVAKTCQRRRSAGRVLARQLPRLRYRDGRGHELHHFNVVSRRHAKRHSPRALPHLHHSSPSRHDAERH